MPRPPGSTGISICPDIAAALGSQTTPFFLTSSTPWLPWRYFFVFSTSVIVLLFLCPPLKYWCWLRTPFSASVNVTTPLGSLICSPTHITCVLMIPNVSLPRQVDMPTHISKPRCSKLNYHLLISFLQPSPPCWFPIWVNGTIQSPKLGTRQSSWIPPSFSPRIQSPRPANFSS